MRNNSIIYLLLFFILLAISCLSVMADDKVTSVKTESAGFPYLVAQAADVKVYDYPDIQTGRIIYILSLFEDVYAREETIDLFIIDGRIGTWVKITSPVVGWVFSEYLGY